eukprot:PhF_6_TR40184/c0_g2_i1/m.59603
MKSYLIGNKILSECLIGYRFFFLVSDQISADIIDLSVSRSLDITNRRLSAITNLKIRSSPSVILTHTRTNTIISMQQDTLMGMSTTLDELTIANRIGLCVAFAGTKFVGMRIVTHPSVDHALILCIQEQGLYSYELNDDCSAVVREGAASWFPAGNTIVDVSTVTSGSLVTVAVLCTQSIVLANYKLGRMVFTSPDKATVIPLPELDTLPRPSRLRLTSYSETTSVADITLYNEENGVLARCTIRPPRRYHGNDGLALRQHIDSEMVALKSTDAKNIVRRMELEALVWEKHDFSQQNTVLAERVKELVQIEENQRLGAAYHTSIPDATIRASLVERAKAFASSSLDNFAKMFPFVKQNLVATRFVQQTFENVGTCLQELCDHSHVTVCQRLVGLYMAKDHAARVTFCNLGSWSSAHAIVASFLQDIDANGGSSFSFRQVSEVITQDVFLRLPPKVRERVFIQIFNTSWETTAAAQALVGSGCIDLNDAENSFRKLFVRMRTVPISNQHAVLASILTVYHVVPRELLLALFCSQTKNTAILLATTMIERNSDEHVVMEMFQHDPLSKVMYYLSRSKFTEAFRLCTTVVPTDPRDGEFLQQIASVLRSRYVGVEI